MSGFAIVLHCAVSDHSAAMGATADDRRTCSLQQLDLSVAADCDGEDAMQRVHPALCWEWSLASLRAGLSSDTLSYAISALGCRLRDLRLSWGSIDAGNIVPALSCCTNLTCLELADTSLENGHVGALSRVLESAPGLKTLDLSANELSQIRTLPVEACVHLRWLGLGLNNELKALPTGLSTLTALTLLNIGGNSLEQVPLAIRKLRKLVQLDMGSNRIAALPPWITELTALQVLGLRSLSRRHAPPHGAANNAAAVGGEGAGIPDLSALPLREIDLSDCDLYDCHLPSWLFDLESLEDLDLSENHLNHLPLRSGQLPRLARLSLANQSAWEGEHPLHGCEGAQEMYDLQGVGAVKILVKLPSRAAL
jgi:Leucine-rich repeat (LRR) protein